MATGTVSDFILYEEQFHSGVTETLEQETDAFNAASQGAIVLSSQALKGQYEQETFFKTISNLITRRDPTSVAVVADDNIVHGEHVSVKLNRRFQVGFTRDQWRKIMKTPQEGSLILGQQVGKAILVDYLNSAIRSAVAGIVQQGATTTVTATGGTVNHTELVNGLAKFGDSAGDIVAWVMHSKVWYDLVKQAIADDIYTIGSIAIREAATPTLGRPTIVTDAAPLLNTVPAPDEYTTLGLTVGGIKVVESEGRDVVNDTITGQENIIERVQGEHAFNLSLLGYAWDITNGGPNPDDTALELGTNWDLVATDIKSTAGVAVVTQ